MNGRSVWFQVETNLCTLQNCLTSMMGREITIEQLRQDVGLMIEKITHVTLMFRQIKLTMEEYVCLKVITMLNQGKALRWFSRLILEQGSKSIDRQMTFPERPGIDVENT